ncbi:hypothetical protein JCGZ_19807 [Jatropha curcas]|uniref:Aminotransferase-like plant mobile domain-containing protein n=1 Tax=Jatropha curcas TaxID=180498 RepID=A0A067JTZ5_JATCU|nr:hypothetical protein JCGZ_19807 [Jatropha curcas]
MAIAKGEIQIGYERPFAIFDIDLVQLISLEICPLFEELRIISGRIPIAEEVPVVSRLDIDPASLILPVFGFSTYEISSYDFDADVVPLRLFVDRALDMDCISPYWPSLVCFCILSQYLLLSGIDGYGSLRLVRIVEQMARHYTLFSLILPKTFIWLEEHAGDSSSVLGLMGSPLLLQLWAFEKLQMMDSQSDHLMFDYKPRVYIRCHYHLTDDTVEDWTAIFQNLTFKGVRWTCPWWYTEGVTVFSYMLYVPLCGLTMAVTYYPNCVARHYGSYQAIPDYTQFEGGLITQQFLSCIISTWRSCTTVTIFDVAYISSSDLYSSWLQAYSGVGVDSLIARFLLGPGMQMLLSCFFNEMY